MKKRTAILPLACLTLFTGCDLSWQAPALAILAISDLNDGDDESWWDNNDEHFDWQWWPFN